jgi:FkbM family methyltransferase
MKTAPYGLDELKAQAEKNFVPSSNWLDQKVPIVLYGAGNFGREVLATLRSRNVPVAAFIDGKLAEPALREGLPIYPLDHPLATEYARKGCVVLLTIFNHLVDWSEIVGVLRQRGFSQIITPMEIFDVLPEIGAARYWIAPSSFYAEKWSSFLDGADLWDDEASREIYRRILWFRLGRDLAAHPSPQLDCQYAPRDLPRWQEPIRLLDGGACVGEALKTLFETDFKIEHYYAWEPDLANFEKLESYLQQECPHLAATLFPCGLGSKTASLSFTGGLGAASAIAEGGGDKTVVLRADEAIRNQRVTLVKLDIEGAETEALLGMRSLIERDRPGLAVCVYHKPDDIITIPALIKSWNLSYRLYLRAHCWNTFDTVLYALPD